METRCFACARNLTGLKAEDACTEDGQIVQVGAECYRKISKCERQARKDGTYPTLGYGYQPPKGGPRLYWAGSTG